MDRNQPARRRLRYASIEIAARSESASAARESLKSWWSLFSALTLGGLLLYLLVRQALEPGFTNYWGYMTIQIVVTLTAVLALEVYFRAEGGLSWYTHLVVSSNTWADTLGTAGHLYERHASYDKITHFCAGIAITAAAADLLRALNERGVISSTLGRRLVVAISATLLINVGWEAYEYLGDVVFDSTRHQGSLDTSYDLMSDLTGAMVAAFLIVRAQPRPLGVDRGVAVVTRA